MRNRVRRRIREIYRLAESEMLPGVDIVIVARARAVGSCFREQKEDLFRLFNASGLILGGNRDEKLHS